MSELNKLKIIYGNINLVLKGEIEYIKASDLR